MAQAALKAVTTAEVEYRMSNALYGTLAQLGTPVAHPPYIDDVLAAGTKNGYVFVTSNIAASTFHCSAVPVTAKATGVRSFCITEDGVIRVQAAGGVIANHDACSLLPATTP
jgi:hypothetical protein